MAAFPRQVSPGAHPSMSASDPGKPIALLQAVTETNMAAFPQQVNPGARLLMSASDPGKPIAQIRLRLQLESQREDQPTLPLEIQRPVSCPEVSEMNMVAFLRLD